MSVSDQAAQAVLSAAQARASALAKLLYTPEPTREYLALLLLVEAFRRYLEIQVADQVAFCEGVATMPDEVLGLRVVPATRTNPEEAN